MSKRVIAVLCWVDVTGYFHYCYPHGCLHENGKVYVPFWARGKEAMAKEAQLREEGKI